MDIDEFIKLDSKTELFVIQSNDDLPKGSIPYNAVLEKIWSIMCDDVLVGTDELDIITKVKMFLASIKLHEKDYLEKTIELMKKHGFRVDPYHLSEAQKYKNDG